MAPMSEAIARRVERKTRQRAANRGGILDAAKRVAAREGTVALSLRAVAAEAGYAPASVYEYFRNRAELVLALAAEDLSAVSKALREPGTPSLAGAAQTVLELVRHSGALAAAASVLEAGEAPPEAERLFNGKLIAMLTGLADAAGRPRTGRGEQADVVLIGALIAGMAMMARTGRSRALGFDDKELLQRFEARFSAALT